MSYLCVPLYDSLGENAIEYIINHAEASSVFVSADKLGQLAKALPKVQGMLKHIVVWGVAGDIVAMQASVLSLL